jgi:uncharacterized membrane protein
VLGRERQLEDTPWGSGWGIVVLLFVSTLGGGGMMGGMGSMMSGGMMGGGLFGMLFALLFWAVLVALLISLVAWIFNQSQQRR